MGDIATAIPVVLLGCGIYLHGFLIGAKLGHRAALAEAEAKRKNDDLAARLRDKPQNLVVGDDYSKLPLCFAGPPECRYDPRARMIIWPRGPWWV